MFNRRILELPFYLPAVQASLEASNVHSLILRSLITLAVTPSSVYSRI